MTPNHEALPVIHITHPDATYTHARVTRYSALVRKFENSYATDELRAVDVLVPIHVSTNAQLDRLLKRALNADWRVISKFEIPAVPF